MQERTMMLIKEKLEKKFYRTKSETHRLNELNQDISILKNGKNHLLNEYRLKLNQFKLHPFDANGYQNILNTLVMNRKELVETKQAYQSNIKNIQQDLNSKEGDIEAKKNIIQEKEGKLIDSKQKIDLELYDNDQLRFKYEQLSLDIKSLRKRMQKYAQVEGLQEIILERLQNHRHIGEIKKVI